MNIHDQLKKQVKVKEGPYVGQAHQYTDDKVYMGQHGVWASLSDPHLSSAVDVFGIYLPVKAYGEGVWAKETTHCFG